MDENEAASSQGAKSASGLVVARSGSSGAVAELQQETTATAAARSADARFKLLEINPAGAAY